MSTNSTADISRILNHRRMSATPPSTLPLPPPTTTTNSIPNVHSVATPSRLHSLTHYHHMASLDSKLHPFTSPRSGSINIPAGGQFQHTHLSAVNSLPPVTSIGLMKQRRVEEISSSSDSEDDYDESIHMSAKQLEKIQSERKISGGDFESVASWVHNKRDLLGRSIDRFGRVSSFPNIQPSLNQSGVTDLSHKSNHFPKPASSVAMSLRDSGISKLAQRRYNLRKSSSLGSGLDEDHVYNQVYFASGDKRKEDIPGSHDSLVINDVYEQLDSGSWQSPTSVTNESRDHEQQAQATDPSQHDYESIKEFKLPRQPMSIESEPDYDYVKGELDVDLVYTACRPTCYRSL